MNRLAIVLPAIALLAGCNGGTTIKAENASMAEVAEAAKDAVKLEPGKWETTVSILSMDGPGLPPQVVEQMKAQMKDQKVETCLTPEQVKNPPKDMFGSAANCTYEKFEMSGGKMSGTLVCKAPAGAAMGDIRGTVSGNFASTSYDVTSETTMNMPAMPGATGGKITSKTKVTGKRIGACDAPKAG